MKIAKIIAGLALAITCNLQPATCNAAYLAPQTGHVSLQAEPATATNAAWVIWSARPSYSLRVESIDFDTDTNSTTGNLTYYGGTEVSSASTNGVSGGVAITQTTNIFVITNGNFASNDILIVQNQSSNTTWQATVWGTLGTTGIVVTVPANGNVYGGDLIYRMADIAITRPLTTNEVSHYGQLFTGRNGEPVAIKLGANGAASVNNVGAKIHNAIAVYENLQ